MLGTGVRWRHEERVGLLAGHRPLLGGGDWDSYLVTTYGTSPELGEPAPRQPNPRPDVLPAARAHRAADHRAGAVPAVCHHRPEHPPQHPAALSYPFRRLRYSSSACSSTSWMAALCFAMKCLSSRSITGPTRIWVKSAAVGMRPSRGPDPDKRRRAGQIGGGYAASGIGSRFTGVGGGRRFPNAAYPCASHLSRLQIATSGPRLPEFPQIAKASS